MWNYSTPAQHVPSLSSQTTKNIKNASMGRFSQRSYPIWVFCLGLEDATIRALLELLFLPLDLEPPALWLRCCDDDDGKHSGLMTRGIFFSPLSLALAMASEMIRLAFCCLSSERGDSICCCCSLLCTRFSDTDVYEDDDEEEELLFTGGLSTRTWLLGPLVFLGGYEKGKSKDVTIKISTVYKTIVYLWMDRHVDDEKNSNIELQCRQSSTVTQQTRFHFRIL